MILFPGEQLEIKDKNSDSKQLSDEDINAKYARGEIRIITEQARYPLPSIVKMVEDENYKLDPEFQRRRRWDAQKQSRLIESFIMNVPVPPIFFYEAKLSYYEVMDGLQRLTAIYEFYKDKLVLDGLEEWSELNGRKYTELPEQVKRGIDRRYLSSIILLHETAKDEDDAKKLKQMVFERINSGGDKLEAQESRNAIYNGRLNQLCIKLSRNKYLCRMWNIPEPTEEEVKIGIISEKLQNDKKYKKMEDVELVLRFFAYRQRIDLQKSTLENYLSTYLQRGNTSFSETTINNLKTLFEKTISLVYQVFREKAFRKKQNRPLIAIYDPMMYAFSQYTDISDKVLRHSEKLRKGVKKIYNDYPEKFKGDAKGLKDVRERNELFEKLISDTLGSES
ncbi:MAG: DUF262 domain-containing protein [Desulfococcaceae bacterium]|jgi:hypothetical protein|nr:DUF262 domain-containing protein [Desulfococcaceae bacterium]